MVLRGSKLPQLKSTFNAENLIRRLSWSISGDFGAKSLLKSVSQREIARNSLKPHIFGVQGRSRSSMLVSPESSSAVLVMMSSKFVSICNRSHTRRAKIVVKLRFLRRAPFYDALVRGNLLTQRHQITSLKTRFSSSVPSVNCNCN